MSTPAGGNIRSLADQLLIDLQAFIFAAKGSIRFSDLASAFPTVNRIDLLGSLDRLDQEATILISIQHTATKTSRWG